MRHDPRQPHTKPKGPARHLVPVSDDAGTLIGFYDPKPGPLGHIEYFRPDQTKIGGTGSIEGAKAELHRRALPPHPKYGAVLSGAPDYCDGVTFWPYRAGVGTFVRVSTCRRIEVYRPVHSASYLASLDGQGLGTRFRMHATAYRAAVKAMRTKDQTDLTRPVPRE